MPIDYSKYPSNWKTEIRPAIMKRAGEIKDGSGNVITQACCEMCGVMNKAHGWRTKEGKLISFKDVDDALHDKGYDYFEHELKHCIKKDLTATKGTVVVLTVAHMDHDITNNVPENLKALCQYCHNNYDKEHRLVNRRNTINRKKGLQSLF